MREILELCTQKCIAPFSRIGIGFEEHKLRVFPLVWIPKYRKKVLVGEVQKELKLLIQKCADKHGFSMIAVETDIDHVHVFVSAPPRFSPAWFMNLLKGYTSKML